MTSIPQKTFISNDQYQTLASFFLSLWVYTHKREDYNQETFDSENWAKILDNSGISWRIQNHVSYLAQTRENAGKYLSTLLARINVHVASI